MRLADLGVERFLIASSLLVVIAQRLVRVTCEHCAAPYEPESRVLEPLGVRALTWPAGPSSRVTAASFAAGPVTGVGWAPSR